MARASCVALELLGVGRVDNLAGRSERIGQPGSATLDVEHIDMDLHAPLVQERVQPVHVGLGEHGLGKLQARRPPARRIDEGELRCHAASRLASLSTSGPSAGFFAALPAQVEQLILQALDLLRQRVLQLFLIVRPALGPGP